MTQISKDDQEWLDRLNQEWIKIINSKKLINVYYHNWIITVPLKMYQEINSKYTIKQQKKLSFWIYQVGISIDSIKYSIKYYKTIHTKFFLKYK